MPKNRQHIYWDSDCFLAILNDAEPQKSKLCQSVLKDARDGKILIVTSAIALIEVIRIKGKPRVDRIAEKKITGFLENSYINIRDVTPAVGLKARELIWRHNLRPKDSIHVATALLCKVPTLHAFDTDLLKLNGYFAGLSICQPKIIQYELEFKPNDQTEEPSSQA
jgi:predicted nucleic acid-binding protein